MPEVHRLANLIPEMTEEQYTALVEDIGANGLLHAITLYQGKVLDGRHRQRAIEDLAERGTVIEPRYYEFTGTESEAFAYVISVNLHRRHLEFSQRAALAAVYKKSLQQSGAVKHGGDRTGQESTDRPLQGRAAEIAAVRFAVSPASVYNAEKVLEAAPEVHQLMIDGGIGLREALHQQQPGHDSAPVATDMPHVSHNSGDNEWYTPKEYTEAAREVMGGIDLDPASTDVANEVVGAATYYTVEQNGLTQDWHGRVWMNPPYAQPLIADFCERLVCEVSEGSVSQACVLVNNATETAWFQQLAAVSSAICFPRGRVRFWSPDKVSSAPLQGQAILYIGGNVEQFKSAFAAFGFVVTL